ncbi:MAG: hypothetical protein JSR81_15165 [Proteobacteria bacterium]|nr:hypothetical protein [Pseudomonadota bacterium]
MIALFLLAALAAAAPNTDLAALVENGHFKRARAALPSNPEDASTLALVAKVALAYKELDTAANFAERAAAREPGNADLQFLLCEVYGTQAQQASIFRQPFLGRKTKKAMDAALALDPNHVDSLFVLMLYYHMAPGLIGGDKGKAREMPDRIRALDPPRGWLAEARLAELEKHPERLENLYRQAAAADAKNFPAQLAYARHLAKEKCAEAQGPALAAHKLKPDRIEPYAILATCAARLGDLAHMEEWLRKSEAQIPDDLRPHLQAAKALHEADKEPARAKALLDKYLSQQPEPTAPSHAEARKMFSR